MNQLPNCLLNAAAIHQMNVGDVVGVKSQHVVADYNNVTWIDLGAPVHEPNDDLIIVEKKEDGLHLSNIGSRQFKRVEWPIVFATPVASVTGAVC